MSGRSDQTYLAVALIVASVFLLSGADAVVKAVSADYSLWQIYAARSAFAVPLILALLARHEFAAWRRVTQPWVLIRSLLLVGMWLAYYAALPSMDLSIAATALYTTPLFIALFASAMANEPVSIVGWLGVALGFAGVLAIIRPGTDAFTVWTLLPVAAAVLYALAAIVTRTRCAGENPFVLALGLHACLLTAGGVGTAVVWFAQPAATNSFLLAGWSPMGLYDWILMAALGIIMVGVATGVAKAYQCGPPAVVGTFDYSYLVFASAWGWLFFSERLDSQTLLGMILIISAGCLVLVKPRKPAPLPKAS